MPAHKAEMRAATPAAREPPPPCRLPPCRATEPFRTSIQSILSRPPPCRFAIVQPAEHSKLAVQEEGLAVLRGIKGSVCPIAVIGPYRSGKSFTLNQLMGVGCGECTWNLAAACQCTLRDMTPLVLWLFM